MARHLKRLCSVLLGAAILTFGIYNVHEVVGITEGGGIGFTLLLNHWFGVPLSIVSPAIDLALYALAFKVLGGGFLGWSLVASAAVSGFYGLWEHLPYLLPDLSGRPLVAAVLGGAFVGVGCGLVVRQGGSSGGDDALALSLARLTGRRVATCYLAADVTVLVLSLSYIPLRQVAFSLVTVTVSSLLIDLVSSVGKVGEEGATGAGLPAADRAVVS